MITIYGQVASRTRRVVWALEEVGEPFELRRVDLRSGQHRSSEYRAINPNAKVPAMVDGALVLFESAAICNYIGEKFPEHQLTPKGGTTERAHYDKWMFFAVSELEQPLWNIGKHSFVLPSDKRLPAMLDVARYEWTVAARVLAEAMAGREFMVGGRFTMADILIAHTLFWARGFDVALGHEALDDFADRMAERPAYRRTLEDGRYDNSS